MSVMSPLKTRRDTSGCETEAAPICYHWKVLNYCHDAFAIYCYFSFFFFSFFFFLFSFFSFLFSFFFLIFGQMPLLHRTNPEEFERDGQNFKERMKERKNE